MIFLSTFRGIITYIMLISPSLGRGSSDHKNSEIARVLHRPIRALTFPETSTMGLFFALAIPLEAPRNSVSLSYFFEASYNLPPNATLFEPWNERKKRKKRGIDRTTVYKTVENKFKREVNIAVGNALGDSVDILNCSTNRVIGNLPCVPTRCRLLVENIYPCQIVVCVNASSNTICSGLPGRGCLLRSICETSEYPLHHNGVLGDIVHVLFTPSTSNDEDLPQDIVKAELVGRDNNCSKYHAHCPVGLFDLIGILV